MIEIRLKGIWKSLFNKLFVFDYHKTQMEFENIMFVIFLYSFHNHIFNKVNKYITSYGNLCTQYTKVSFTQ